MRAKVALFDFDGTLADTLPLSFKAFQTVFAKYDGRTVTEEELVAMFGPTEDAIIEANLGNKAAIPDSILEYYDIYRTGHAENFPQYPEVTDLLARLKRHGMKIGVVTGKSRKAFDISAEALQLGGYFDVTITGDDVAQPKPHPEGLFKALDVLGAKPEEAVFLGDSNADIKAGKAAGVRTFGVHWLSTYQTVEFEVAPEAIFGSVAEFLALLQE